jgi:hypothetical protein
LAVQDREQQYPLVEDHGVLVAGLSKNSTPSYAVYCSLNSGLQFLFATEPFVLALQRLETDEGVQELLRRHWRRKW